MIIRDNSNLRRFKKNRKHKVYVQQIFLLKNDTSDYIGKHTKNHMNFLILPLFLSILGFIFACTGILDLNKAVLLYSH